MKKSILQHFLIQFLSQKLLDFVQFNLNSKKKKIEKTRNLA